MMALDVLVGVGCLLAALSLRRSPKLALLAAATGLLWFAGDLVGPLMFAHRAPVTHLLLLYPATRLQSRHRYWTVGVVYAASLVYPLARLPAVTVLLFGAIVVAALAGRPPRDSADRRSANLAGAGAVLVWGLLAIGALARGAGAQADSALLVAYEVGLLVAMASVVADERYRRSPAAIVTTLAVDLGATGARSLRDVVAEALGDPSVVIGLPAADGFTDEDGQPVVLSPTTGQVVTELLEHGQPVAVLQHDASLLRDRTLLDSVTALAAVALSNTRLQRDLAASIAEVAASRRRLLDVADAERDRLESELQESVLGRLARVATSLPQVGSADLCRQLDATRETIRAFARGVYPRALDEAGLAAIRDVAPPGVEITEPGRRYPREIEAAAYFLCVEALTNVAKYAHATRTTITITAASRRLLVEVDDNGFGGADLAKGTGLLGLQDRLDVLGGTLIVQSSSQGTRICGSIPLQPPKTSPGPFAEARCGPESEGVGELSGQRSIRQRAHSDPVPRDIFNRL